MTNTAYYDGIAKGYDELHKVEQENKLAIIIPKLNEKLQQMIRESKDELICIDIGSGTGFSLDILEAETKQKWIGVEPSVGMTKQYKGKQQLLVARGESLPFPDAYADACVSITAIQNFDDIAKGIEEMSRVTKENAPIIVSCLKKSPKLGLVSQILADTFIVEELIEEEKDIIFVCQNKKHIFVEDEV
jgi:demethylmenaquinone methyltransferase/2-methoxy-6-polyprenyl-1,4-benzoquinol methylase